MRKIFKLSLLALFIGVVSCEDATDIIQADELNEETAYRTVDDLQSGLNGVYSSYAPDAASNGLGDSFLFNDLFTDNIKRGASNIGQGSSEYNFVINTNTNFPNTIWAARYRTINLVNRVLSTFDRVLENATDAEVTRANSIKAQLLAFRALSHFELFQYFTVDYKNASSPSVIIMDFVPPLGAVYPRNTVGDVLSFIKSDLDSADELMGTSTDPFYLTKDALKVIRARVLLFEGNSANYSAIEGITEELLTSHPIIDSPEDYEGFWQDANLADVREDIFTLFRGQNDNGIAGLFYANNVGEDGSPFFEMSNELFDLYGSDDVRKIVWVKSSSVPGQILINKYPGSSTGQLSNHVKLFRSSEMLLVKAEAEARQGKLIEAAQSIQSLRAARAISSTPTTPTYANLQDALRDILLERRKELCYEAHRYLDLKRVGPEVNVGINRAPIDAATFSAPRELGPTDYRFTMPIPRNEVDANPSILQNPNY